MFLSGAPGFCKDAFLKIDRISLKPLKTLGQNGEAEHAVLERECPKIGHLRSGSKVVPKYLCFHCTSFSHSPSSPQGELLDFLLFLFLKTSPLLSFLLIAFLLCNTYLSFFMVPFNSFVLVGCVCCCFGCLCFRLSFIIPICLDVCHLVFSSCCLSSCLFFCVCLFFSSCLFLCFLFLVTYVMHIIFVMFSFFSCISCDCFCCCEFFSSFLLFLVFCFFLLPSPPART